VAEVPLALRVQGAVVKRVLVADVAEDLRVRPLVL
jgi:hypothetical protein